MSMKKYTNRGFTLIELLVVIAIIGILSSVVLASLNTARSKGSDAAIKSNLAGMRPQAEIYYDANGSYGTQATSTPVAGSVCTGGVFSDPTIQNQLKAAAAANSSATQVTCGASAGYWAASVPLKTSGHWCVDSTGAAKSIASAVASAGCN